MSKYPGVQFILSSMYYDHVGIATRHKNVYLDTATHMSGGMTAMAVQPVGTHRIVMGSNSPYGLLRREVEKIEVMEEFTCFQKSLIYSLNAERLLKL